MYEYTVFLSRLKFAVQIVIVELWVAESLPSQSLIVTASHRSTAERAWRHDTQPAASGSLLSRPFAAARLLGLDTEKESLWSGHNMDCNLNWRAHVNSVVGKPGSACLALSTIALVSSPLTTKACFFSNPWFASIASVHYFKVSCEMSWNQTLK